MGFSLIVRSHLPINSTVVVLPTRFLVLANQSVAFPEVLGQPSEGTGIAKVNFRDSIFG